jgi:hypothetical protein
MANGDELYDLEALFGPEAADLDRAGPEALPASAAELPVGWQALWDKIAALLEVDGGLPREQAEAHALAVVVKLTRYSKGPEEGRAAP